MKLTKSELKSIVKECLVEILNEGLGGAASSQPAVLSKTSSVGSLSDSMKRPSLPRPTPQMREAILREAGGNKVMESILADTAASTLPKFLQSGDGKTHIPAVGGGLAEQVVSQVNPEDLFGDDVASKWADLAFMGSPIKK